MAEVAGPEPIVALPGTRLSAPAFDAAGVLPGPARGPEHYYDVGAQFTKQWAFDNFLGNTRYGGPQGLNTWLPVVTAHGKLLDVPEWGVWARHTTPAASDSPVYIQGMYQFFKANAAKIAYENYYNCGAIHQLGTTTLFPNASAMYQKLWSAGQ